MGEEKLEEFNQTVAGNSAVRKAPPLLLTEQEVAALLKMSVRTLQTWRHQGRSPPEWRVIQRKLVRYPYAALVRWINEGPTCEAPVRRTRRAAPQSIGEPPHPSIHNPWASGSVVRARRRAQATAAAAHRRRCPE